MVGAAKPHLTNVNYCEPAGSSQLVRHALVQGDVRKLLPALLALGLREHDMQRVQMVATSLPGGHSAGASAAGEDIAIKRPMLIDLGDAGTVKEAIAR